MDDNYLDWLASAVNGGDPKEITAAFRRLARAMGYELIPIAMDQRRPPKLRVVPNLTEGSATDRLRTYFAANPHASARRAAADCACGKSLAARVKSQLCSVSTSPVHNPNGVSTVDTCGHRTSSSSFFSSFSNSSNISEHLEGRKKKERGEELPREGVSTVDSGQWTVDTCGQGTLNIGDAVDPEAPPYPHFPVLSNRMRTTRVLRPKEVAILAGLAQPGEDVEAILREVHAYLVADAEEHPIQASGLLKRLQAEFGEKQRARRERRRREADAIRSAAEVRRKLSPTERAMQGVGRALAMADFVDGLIQREKDAATGQSGIGSDVENLSRASGDGATELDRGFYLGEGNGPDGE